MPGKPNKTSPSQNFFFHIMVQGNMPLAKFVRMCHCQTFHGLKRHIEKNFNEKSSKQGIKDTSVRVGSRPMVWQRKTKRPGWQVSAMPKVVRALIQSHSIFIFFNILSLLILDQYCSVHSTFATSKCLKEFAARKVVF